MGCLEFYIDMAGFSNPEYLNMFEQFFCKQQCTFKFCGTVVFRVIDDWGVVVTTETLDMKPV